MKNRYLTKFIVEDLSEKMVFVGGPRQVGKTTLANKLVAPHFTESAYFCWDYRLDRRKIIASDWPGSAELIVLDEIHKQKGWKNFIKGEFDKLGDRYKFLITGSARLDVYRKGGDSLQGRYHYYRLHPFSLAELMDQTNKIEIFRELPLGREKASSEVELLDQFGGFPEPAIKQTKRFLQRWHNEKLDRLFREDIRDMESIRDLRAMRLLGDLLPIRAASPLSINALREDLQVSHRAASSWMDILESFYYQFRIYPFTGKTVRSLRKESKLYLWDWSEVPDEAARFENMIASHLLKLEHFLHDYEGQKARLYYLRTVDKKEVDFLMTVNEKPWFAVEVKLNEENIAPTLRYFKAKLNIPFAYQVIKKNNVDRFKEGIRVVSADKFMLGLV